MVELSRAGASSVEPQSTPSQVGRESQSQGSHRQSVAKSGHGASGGGGATITSLAWFTLKVRAGTVQLADPGYSGCRCMVRMIVIVHSLACHAAVTLVFLTFAFPDA